MSLFYIRKESDYEPFGMIPFFIPHVGCPYVCTFCNQSRITGQSGISHLTPGL